MGVASRAKGEVSPPTTKHSRSERPGSPTPRDHVSTSSGKRGDSETPVGGDCSTAVSSRSLWLVLRHGVQCGRAQRATQLARSPHLPASRPQRGAETAVPREQWAPGPPHTPLGVVPPSVTRPSCTCSPRRGHTAVCRRTVSVAGAGETYLANWKMSKTNFSIFIPFGLSGLSGRPRESTHGIFFWATWCCSCGSCTLSKRETVVFRARSLGAKAADQD